MARTDKSPWNSFIHITIYITPTAKTHKLFVFEQLANVVISKTDKQNTSLKHMDPVDFNKPVQRVYNTMKEGLLNVFFQMTATSEFTWINQSHRKRHLDDSTRASYHQRVSRRYWDNWFQASKVIPSVPAELLDQTYPLNNTWQRPGIGESLHPR